MKKIFCAAIGTCALLLVPVYPSSAAASTVYEFYTLLADDEKPLEIETSEAVLPPEAASSLPDEVNSKLTLKISELETLLYEITNSVYGYATDARTEKSEELTELIGEIQIMYVTPAYQALEVGDIDTVTDLVDKGSLKAKKLLDETKRWAEEQSLKDAIESLNYTKQRGEAAYAEVKNMVELFQSDLGEKKANMVISLADYYLDRLNEFYAKDLGEINSRDSYAVDIGYWGYNSGIDGMANRIEMLIDRIEMLLIGI